MTDHSDNIISGTVGGVVLLIVAAAIVGMTTCTRRDWAFEDACRRAGGVVMDASRVTSASSGSAHDICGKVIQSPVAIPTPLPDYRR